MSRFARLAVLLTLAGALSLPHTAVAAPPYHQEGRPAATAHEWFAGLWAPLARLLGATNGGPGIDPDGAVDGNASGGPGIDPNGIGGGPMIDPNGAFGQSEGGPYIDPDGAADGPSPSGTEGSSAGDGESDGGPMIDPDG